MAYRQIAVLTLKKLFGVGPQDRGDAEGQIYQGAHRGRTFHWEEAMQAGLLTADDARRLTELRMIRNTQVHSSNVDRKEVEHAVYLAKTLLSGLDTK
ncbi:MAG: hypothetical protein M3Z36_10995 [Acidobacteriota bacterium]|nr:hypothetical protein [Acidobacteriota bacterium]